MSDIIVLREQIKAQILAKYEAYVKSVDMNNLDMGQVNQDLAILNDGIIRDLGYNLMRDEINEMEHEELVEYSDNMVFRFDNVEEAIEAFRDFDEIEGN